MNTRASIIASAALAAASFSFPGSFVVSPPGPQATAGASASTNKTAPASLLEQRKQNAAIRSLLRGSAVYRARPRGPGWTHAQVQRMAKKRKNVRRNRRAQR